MTVTPAERREALQARHPQWVERTISQQFDAAADEFADRPFFITSERTWTYAEMRDWSRQIASGLIAKGIQAGDHVALVMGNFPEFAAIKLAISRVGAACVPINFMLRRRELAYVLEQSDSRALFVMDALRDIDYGDELDSFIGGWETSAGGDAIGTLEHVFVLPCSAALRDGATSVDDVAAAATPESDAELPEREAAGDPRFRCDVIYTSGTTGRPKGSMATHDQINRVAYGSAYARAYPNGHRMIFALPMYHVFGYIECMIAATFVGGAIIPHVNFDAKQFVEDAERFQATDLVAVPVMTVAILDAVAERGFDTSNVFMAFNSGGQSPHWIWDRIRDELGAKEQHTAYGMTETTASTVCVLAEDPPERLRTCHGRIKPAGVAGLPEYDGGLVEYRAVDPATREDMPPGEDGELICRGAVVTTGYYNKPEETAEAFDSDGWFQTGDIGHIDADGYLTLTGRLKESFRCGGEMVMPKEIEDLVNEHPLVQASYVVGLPHEKMGEVGCVCIVPSGDERVTADEIVELCKENLARYKVPRHVVFVTADEVPMTATGRPQKFKLLDLAKGRVAEGEAAAAP